MAILTLFHLLIHNSPAVTGQPVASIAEPDKNKSVVNIMVIVVVLVLILGFLSIYSRKWSNQRAETHGMLETSATDNSSQTEPKGLNQATIETFPRFRYSDVKGLKIGKDTLLCAVCLSEFQDDETLRIIPICCHVYHPNCIDVWLASHTTCPVCRAELMSK
ncbi:hypothetical protein VNO78_31059 [Psophocarpus tetragonolobus]|uniref:RING-type E3 ubiquitin transferase n=1 Tax=Psophocarpus tetragonolobus TaxID=3891 RepID=A0AAN9RXT0_PSOTE